MGTEVSLTRQTGRALRVGTQDINVQDGWGGVAEALSVRYQRQPLRPDTTPLLRRCVSLRVGGVTRVAALLEDGEPSKWADAVAATARRRGVSAICLVDPLDARRHKDLLTQLVPLLLEYAQSARMAAAAAGVLLDGACTPLFAHCDLALWDMERRGASLQLQS